MTRVLLGILITAIGFLVVWRSEKVFRFFGRSSWAEKYLRYEGGSHLFYKLVGVAIIFLGLFIISNIWTDIMRGITGIFVQ